MEDSSELENHNVTEALARLEGVGSLSGIDKMNMLLVAEGLKPASLVEMYFEAGHNEYTEADYERDIELTQQVLGRLGLITKVEMNTDPVSRQAIVMMAKDTGQLMELEKARNGSRDEGAALGTALGFPKTAVDAFVQGKDKMLTEIPTEIKDDPARKFVGFVMSKDHWREEIEIGKRNAGLVKKIAPKLYDEVLAGQ